ncbi:zinc ribbon domain-containing protein [Candidatus Bathyarchaeota archaeon]|nr:MAG: zinc ribbon domain-containing protein [Candidatus Bathyarchaeota archaeon]
MPNCPACGKEVQPTTQYCPACGTNLMQGGAIDSGSNLHADLLLSSAGNGNAWGEPTSQPQKICSRDHCGLVNWLDRRWHYWILVSYSGRLYKPCWISYTKQPVSRGPEPHHVQQHPIWKFDVDCVV